MQLRPLSISFLLLSALAVAGCQSSGRQYSGTYAGDITPSTGESAELEVRNEPPAEPRTRPTVPEPEPEPEVAEAAPAVSPSNPQAPRTLGGDAQSPQQATIDRSQIPTPPPLQGEPETSEIETPSVQEIEAAGEPPAVAEAPPPPSVLSQPASSGSGLIADGAPPPPPASTAPQQQVAAVPSGAPATTARPASATAAGSTDPLVAARSQQMSRSVLAQELPEVGDDATPEPPASSDLYGGLGRPASAGGYPNLASVPTVPDDLPSDAERARILEQLERDRALLRQSRVGMVPDGNTGTTAPPLPPGGVGSSTQRSQDEGLLTGADGALPVMPTPQLNTGSVANPSPTAPQLAATTEGAGAGAQSVFDGAFSQSGASVGNVPATNATGSAQPLPQTTTTARFDPGSARSLATTVTFGSGSANLSQTAITAIDQLVAQVTQNGLAVRVVGYASVDRGDGVLVENTRLAIARANAIAGRMIGRGVAPDQIRMEASGQAVAGVDQAQVFLP